MFYKEIMLGVYFLAIVSSVYLMGCNGATLGEACADTIDCTGTYQYCDTTCKCNTGYTQYGSYCLAELGYSCTFDTDCNSVNAICSGSICTCDTTTRYDSNGENTLGGLCVNKIPYGGGCVLAGSCADDNTECIDNTCQCFSGYHRQGSVCVINIAYEDDCSGGGTCAGDNTECIGGTCQCSSGYNWDNSACFDNNLAHGDDCSGGGTCTGDNTECSGGTCQCTSGYFWNSMVCAIKISTGSSCPSDLSPSVPCSDTNAECTSTGIGYKCTCIDGYYIENGVCTISTLKELLGTSCTFTTDCADVNAECSSQKCTCKSGYYDNTGTSDTGGTCIEKKTLGSLCPNPSVTYISSTGSCKDSNALCQLSGSTYACRCRSTYYDDNGVNILGGNCRFKILLGAQCPVPTNAVPNSAICSDSIATCVLDGNIYKCLCPSDYYDSNGVNTAGGECLPKKTFGSICPNPSVTNILSTDSCEDSNALCQQSGSTYICSCRNCANQLSCDSEATSSDMTAIIVGVVLGIIILVLMSCIGYLMIKLRRLSKQDQTKQPEVQLQPQYVNQMFLDVVSQSPDVENIPSPEDNYASLNEETREEKSIYETF